MSGERLVACLSSSSDAFDGRGGGTLQSGRLELKSGGRNKTYSNKK